MKSPKFEDITEHAQVAGHPEFGGHGVVIVDVRSTGRDDIYISNNNGPVPNLFYANHGQFRFEELAARYGIEMFAPGFDDVSHGVVVADLNHDGKNELFVTAARGVGQLFTYDGGSDVFEDVTMRSGLAAGSWGTRGVVAADFDGDGYLDLFLHNNSPGTGHRDAGGDNVFFRNDGTGFFVRVDAAMLGLSDPRRLGRRTGGLGQGCVAVDYDDDGLIDLYCCVRGAPNRLFKNVGNGLFYEAAQPAGIACLGGGDGATFVDLNNDGHLDLVVAGSWRGDVDRFIHIYLNRGDGTFADVTLEHQIPGGSYHVLAADFNNDGWPDLYVTRAYQPNTLYLNEKGEHFVAVECGAEVDQPDCRCAASGDLEGKGSLDIFIAHKRGYNVLLRNTLSDSNWIKVSLLGPKGDLGGIGTKVYLYEQDSQGNKTRLVGHQQAMSAYGYVGQNSGRLHFGIEANKTYCVEAKFVDGHTHTESGVTPGTALTLDGRGRR